MFEKLEKFDLSLKLLNGLKVNNINSKIDSVLSSLINNSIDLKSFIKTIN
jgi:hypothetical protein